MPRCRHRSLTLRHGLVGASGRHERGQLPGDRTGRSIDAVDRAIIWSSRRSSEITAVPMWPRSLVSTAIPTPQPPCSGPSRWSAGSSTSVKNTSSNSELAGHLLQWADLDAGQVHRAEEERDAVVLRCLRSSWRADRSGPSHQDPPVAASSTRAPHLLAVDDETVAVGFGPGGQRRQIAARTRLGEQLAPHVVGVERRVGGGSPAARVCRSEAARRRRARARPCSGHGGTPALAHSRSHAALVLDGEAQSAVLDRPVHRLRTRRHEWCVATSMPASMSSGGQIAP